jgi:hypothetical protein
MAPQPLLLGVCPLCLAASDAFALLRAMLFAVHAMHAGIVFTAPGFFMNKGGILEGSGALPAPLVAACGLLCDPTPNPAANPICSLSVCLREGQNVSLCERTTRADGDESGAKLSHLELV